MTRIPRVRLRLVLAVLFVLLVVPMAGARTLSSPSLHSADGSWLGTALRWADSFFTVHPVSHRGHAGGQILPQQNDDQSTKTPQSGGCVGPDGRPKPICF